LLFSLPIKFGAATWNFLIPCITNCHVLDACTVACPCFHTTPVLPSNDHTWLTISALLENSSSLSSFPAIKINLNNFSFILKKYLKPESLWILPFM